MPFVIKWHGKRFLEHVDGRKITALRFFLREAIKKAEELVPVDTGALKAGIRKVSEVNRVDKRNPFATLGSDVFYTPFIELGTSKMPAQPFLRPAMITAARRLGSLRKL